MQALQCKARSAPRWHHHRARASSAHPLQPGEHHLKLLPALQIFPRPSTRCAPRGEALPWLCLGTCTSSSGRLQDHCLRFSSASEPRASCQCLGLPPHRNLSLPRRFLRGHPLGALHGEKRSPRGLRPHAPRPLGGQDDGQQRQ